MGYPVTDVTAFLRGTWVIDRDINDSRDGLAGRFVGTAEFAAEFAPDGDSWSWVEAGELQWATDSHRAAVKQAAVKQRAGRRLLLAVRPDLPCVVDVTFDDGRFFHRADLSSGSDTFVHGCPPDTYYGSWTVVSPDRFRLAWDVDGPAKKLTIRSTYSRA